MADDQTIEFTLNGFHYSLKYRDSDHSYRVMCDGGPWNRYVGISTLSKVSYFDPGGLMTYAYKHGVAGTDYKEATKFTQECGTAAHDCLEAFINTGEPLDPLGEPERVRGAVAGVVKWLEEYTPTFISSEVIVCSPTHRFAGRFDFLAEVEGELVLADLKTTDKNWEHFHRYKAQSAYAQLAGYSTAQAEMKPDDPQPTKRAILHVNTSGDFDWKPDLAPMHSEDSFLSKLKTYRLDYAWSKAYNAGAKQQKVAA